MKQINQDVKLKYYPDEEEMKAAQLACCGRHCTACETPAEYAWRKREVDMAILLEKAIREELTQTEREIITEFWFNSESLTSIASKRNIKPPSVKGTLNRAQEKIENALRYAVCYQQNIMSETIIPVVVGRARVIAAARNSCSGSCGDRITRLRQSQSLSRETLESATGIPLSRISKIELGSNPTADELVALSEFFDVTTDFILKGEFND